jgi:DNA-binding NarL/FixJ family response regulator
VTDAIAGPRGSVLIVDDAPGNLAFLSDALQDAGYKVFVATDGAVALEQLHYVTPDVILLDAVMPGMDGFETCRKLQGDPVLQQIPVIFMTALSELEYLLKAFSEGAVDYLVKPIRHEEVLARVATHVALARKVRHASDALQHGGFAAVTVDRQGVIMWLTGAAAQWLKSVGNSADGPVPRVGDSVPHAIRAWLHAQLDGAEDFASARFSTTLGDHVYTAKLAVSPHASEHLLLLQSKSTQWDLDTVRCNFGLTLREAEIIMWISRGKTNKDVAEILGSSPRTINKHLEHVFEKLGVETRTAAVSVVLDRMGVVSGIPDGGC